MQSIVYSIAHILTIIPLDNYVQHNIGSSHKWDSQFLQSRHFTKHLSKQLLPNHNRKVMELSTPSIVLKQITKFVSK